jgi:hypothetical protein
LLLHDVGYFVRHQGKISGSLTGTEKHMGAIGKRAGAQSVRCSSRSLVGMHAHGCQGNFKAIFE